MANALPKNIQAKVKRAVYKKADEFGYMECGRIESGRFLDTLVDDPEVGKVIIEYMPKERVRTYIKDGVLNAYTKAATKRALADRAAPGIVVVGKPLKEIRQQKRAQIGKFHVPHRSVRIRLEVMILQRELRAAEDLACEPKQILRLRRFELIETHHEPVQPGIHISEVVTELDKLRQKRLFLLQKLFSRMTNRVVRQIVMNLHPELCLVEGTRVKLLRIVRDLFCHLLREKRFDRLAQLLYTS